MTSNGKDDRPTTYNTGSCKTGKSVVSAMFTSGGWWTHLVLGRNKGRYMCLGRDFRLVSCQDWHAEVNGESNNSKRSLEWGEVVEV